jgi:integrase
MVRGVFIERGPSAKTLFSAALDRYLSEVTPTKRPTTQRAEKTKAIPLREFFGKYSLAGVTAELVSKFRDKRLDQGKKPNTVRLELALISHLFTTAIREWGIGLNHNPVSMVRKPSPGAGRDRRISATEERRLRKEILKHSNPMLGWIFEIAIETGMRSSEITGLKLSQLNIKRRVVRLSVTKNDEARTVPLTDTACKAFGAALANPLRPEDCDLIFFGEPGRLGVRNAYNFNKAWLRIKDAVGLKSLHFHDLRHEAVSRLVEGGFSDQEVSAISGHKSMQMLKRYTHLRAEDLVDRVNAAAARRALR